MRGAAMLGALAACAVGVPAVALAAAQESDQPEALNPSAALADLEDKSECMRHVKTVKMVRSVWSGVRNESKSSNSTHNTTRLSVHVHSWDHVLLIARYDEHLDWLVNLLHRWDWITNVLILNKGGAEFPVRARLPANRVVIRKAENVGREGETLLRFIIQEYDRLPQRLWFLQADPLTHQPNMELMFDPEVIKRYDPTFQPLTMQFAEYARIPDKLLEHEEQQLDGNVRQLYITVANGAIVFANGMNEDEQAARQEGVFGFSSILDAMQDEHAIDDRLETVRSICRYLNMTVPNRTDSLIPYTMSAMFAMSGEAIHRYPRLFYEDVRKWLIYDDFFGSRPLRDAVGGSGVNTCKYLRQGGRRGYLLERLWQYMFTGIQVDGRSRPRLQTSWLDPAPNLAVSVPDITQPIDQPMPEATLPKKEEAQRR